MGTRKRKADWFHPKAGSHERSSYGIWREHRVVSFCPIPGVPQHCRDRWLSDLSCDGCKRVQVFASGGARKQEEEDKVDRLSVDDQWYFQEESREDTFEEAAGEALYGIGVDLEAASLVEVDEEEEDT